MKIGILTFVNAVNYGAVLQAYASQKFLNDAGYDAQLINYTPAAPKQNITQDAPKPGKLNHLISIAKHPFKFISAKAKTKKTNNFKNIYLKISPTKYVGEISELKEKFDIVIAGSDQIWNTDLSFASKTFFLDFKTSAKKVGYAVSVGREQYSELDKEMIHKYNGNFEKISVRENSLKDYLKKQENKESIVVCDPVFLIEQKDWNSICVSPKKSGYILVYAMEYNETLINTIKKLKKDTHKRVYFINGGGYHINKSELPGKIINAQGPKEFLGWIKNADIVLTNSFHGAAFSVIFKKELIILEHSTRNERLIQLADVCGCKDKLLKINSDNFEKYEYTINSKIAYKNIESFIKKSKEYMLSICRE